MSIIIRLSVLRRLLVLGSGSRRSGRRSGRWGSASVLFMISVLLDVEAELLFFGAELLLEHLVCSPDRLAFEQAIDLLEGNTTGLGNEEESEEERQEGEGSEEHVHSVSHSLEHLLSEAGNEEVEEPVAGGGGGLGEGAEVGVEELGVNDPGGTVPGWGVDGSPQVEEENSSDTSAVKRGGRVFLGLHDADVGTNDPHADRSGHGTTEEQVASTNLVDKEEEPHESHNGLDHTEDTGHQVGSLAVNTNLEEEG